MLNLTDPLAKSALEVANSVLFSRSLSPFISLFISLSNYLYFSLHCSSFAVFRMSPSLSLALFHFLAPFPSFSLSISPSLCLLLHLSISLSLCLPLSISPSLCLPLSISPFISLSVSLSDFKCEKVLLYSQSSHYIQDKKSERIPNISVYIDRYKKCISLSITPWCVYSLEAEILLSPHTCVRQAWRVWSCAAPVDAVINK